MRDSDISTFLSEPAIIRRGQTELLAGSTCYGSPQILCSQLVDRTPTFDPLIPFTWSTLDHQTTRAAKELGLAVAEYELRGVRLHMHLHGCRVPEKFGHRAAGVRRAQGLFGFGLLGPIDPDVGVDVEFVSGPWVCFL